MKIGRRGFISLGLGASAGLTLSPVPWKLLDDVAIWTQNWPWVPVPKEGKVSERHTVCTLCPGGCGITVRKVDERVTSIKGREDFPINKGGICPLGLSGPQLLYTPVRVMSPALKIDGSFRQISWNQASKILVNKLIDLQKEKRPDRLVCLSDSDQGTVSQLFHRFLTAFESPNHVFTPTIDDTWEAVTQRMFGKSFLPGYDLENADYLLSFGCGLIEGWGIPTRMIQMHGQRIPNRTRIVQVEPRLSNTAAGADQWIAIKPGTEADLALGMAHVILRNSLSEPSIDGIDKRQWDALKEVIRSEYPPHLVEKKTGIDQKVIESLAFDFARSEKPLALCGKGQGRLPGDSKEFSAVLILNILLGNLNQPGGIYYSAKVENFKWPSLEPNDMAIRGLESRRTGLNDKNGSTGKVFADAFFQSLAESETAPVDVLLVNNTNPCYTQMANNTVNRAIQKIPLVVSFSTYWDETAVNADLILPNYSYLERYQDFPIHRGLIEPVMALSQPVSKQIFDTRYPGDILIETAHKMKGPLKDAFPWKNYLHCLKTTLGESWNEMTENGFKTVSPTESRSVPSPVNLVTMDLKGSGTLPQGDSEKFPLLLLPKDSMRLTNGTIGSPPFMIKTVEASDLKGNKSLIDIHPGTAKKFALKEGQSVRLTTPIAEVAVDIHLDEGTMPGIVVLSRGLGHLAHDKFLAHKGANFNNLIGPVEDPQTGLNAAWGIRCSLKEV